MTRATISVLVLVTASLASCGPSSGEEAHVAVTDSAGVRVVTTIQPEWTDPLPLALPEPVVSVPAEGASSPLSRVLAAEVLADGRIAVLDGLLEQVVVYDREGQEVGLVGRPGQGPGEFVQAATLLEGSDGSLQVYDLRQRRLSTFHHDGVLSGVQTLQAEGEGYPARAWQLSDQDLIVWLTYRDLSTAVRRGATAGLEETPGALVRLVDAEVSDTLLTGVQSLSIREGEGPSLRLWAVPFGSVSAFAVDPADSRIVFTSGARHSIHVLEVQAGNSSREILRHPTADRPISSEELEARRDHARQTMAEEGATPPTALDFLYDPELQPAVRPAFGKVLWGPDGSIWAQRFEPIGVEPRLWWVISAEGAFRGLVEMPERTDILSFEDGHMLLLELDEFDVPTVHLVPFSGLDNRQVTGSAEPVI